MNDHRAGCPAGKQDVATEEARPCIPTWKDLESCLRAKMRGWPEDVVEADVDELSAAGVGSVGGRSAQRLATRTGTGSPELSR
jgi:hypothetical protein